MTLTDGRREVAEQWRRAGPPPSTSPQHVQILVGALLDALEEAEQTRDQLLHSPTSEETPGG